MNAQLSTLSTEFFNLGEVVRSQLSRFDLHLPKPDSKLITDFENLKLSEQLAALDRLKFEKSICEHAVSESITSIHDPRLTWFALKSLKLRPPSGLFESLEHDECIEIYDGAGKQLYRNFKFFLTCSYSFEDLIIHPWFHLYDRDITTQSLMMSAAERCLTSSTGVETLSIPVHSCKEKVSLKKYNVSVLFKKICPLHSSSKVPTAFLVTSELKLAGSAPGFH